MLLTIKYHGLNMFTTETINAWIAGVVSSVFFALVAFLALNRSKRVDAVLVRLWDAAPFKTMRKFVWGIFLLLFAATVLGIFYDWYINIWHRHAPLGVPR